MYSLFLAAAVLPLMGQSDGAAWAKAVHAGTEAMKRYGNLLLRYARMNNTPTMTMPFITLTLALMGLPPFPSTPGNKQQK